VAKTDLPRETSRESLDYNRLITTLDEGHEFSIGSPYPDRAPEHLAGGVLYINEVTFENSVLTTFDGNDYFAISIRTRAMEILIQDDGSAYP
jgi:hypothetical protein